MAISANKYITVLITVLFSACDLFSNLPENDLEKIIDDKVAYAHAAPANVSIGSIPGSVNTITGSLGEVKQGYSFTVNFTPNPDWVFTGWEALLSADFSAYQNGTRQEQLAIAGKTQQLVAIVEERDLQRNKTGEAQVTVSTGLALTLVPHCIERPKVKTTNLPGNFFDRKVTNYPVHIWFNREIHPDCVNFNNFIITAETNQGFGGRTLEGAEITKYFNQPVSNGKQVIITRLTSGTDSEFVNLNLTIRLNLGAIYDEAFRVCMGDVGKYQDLYYAVHHRSYTTPPDTERMEAAAGKENKLFSGSVSPSENESIADSTHMVPLENGERVTYLLFDADRLDQSINLEYTTLDNVRITEKKEGVSYQSENEYPYAEYRLAAPDPALSILVDKYKAKHGSRTPYIVRHVLLTETDGIIQLAVQPTDTLGNRESFAEAKKVRVLLDTVSSEIPVITGQPQSGSYSENDTITLSVTASVTDGGSLSYQWYRNAANSNSGGTAIPNAKSASYDPPAGTVGAYYYYVVITNTNNSAIGDKTASIISDVAAVTIYGIINAQTPTITVHPQGGNYSDNDTVTLSVTASVTDEGSLSYQWYSNASSSNSGGTAIPDAKSASYDPPVGAVGTYYYYVVVTNTNNAANGDITASIASSVAVIIINNLINAQRPVITTQPQGGEYYKDHAVTLSVTASSADDGALSYQWYSNTSNSNSGGSLILGAVSASYSPLTDTEGTYYYYVVVTNTNNNVDGTKTAAVASAVAVVKILLTQGIVINVEGMDEWDLLNQERQVAADSPAEFSVNGIFASYKWYVDGSLAGNGATYTFNRRAGIYELVVVVSNSPGEERSGRCWVTAVRR